MSKRFYITTAIDYVNGQPHLGHAYEKIVTDVIARARRSLGQEVFFLTGLDEHGQKVQQAALAKGQSPQAYCDELAAQWRAFVAELGITNDDFIRTTQPRHKEVVQALLNKLHAQDDLYKAPYRGWYSWKEETFLTDKDREPDGSWHPRWGEVKELVEDNWYFRMAKHQQWLTEYIEANPAFVQPDTRRNEVLGFLKSRVLEDLCISRPAARLSWGIPIPFDPEYVNYVWFDALTKYLSVPATLGDPVLSGALHSQLPTANPQLELWPADIHVIGKDIVRFHAIYWPIMLHAAGIPLPKQVLVHGWWQKDGSPMSKTIGNVVAPVAVVDEWGVDALRYYVLRELDIGPDGNWTDAGFRARYQAELANGLGNLVNRSLSMLKRYRNGVVPKCMEQNSDAIQTPEFDLLGTAKVISKRVIECLEHNKLQGSLKEIWSLVDGANAYVDYNKPFSLAKVPTQSGRLDVVLYNLAETCRVLAVLLWPFIPQTATKIFAQLGLTGAPDKFSAATWGGLQLGHKIGEPAPLFPRKDV
jgi:methionyl-tRNA synthetase